MMMVRANPAVHWPLGQKAAQRWLAFRWAS